MIKSLVAAAAVTIGLAGYAAAHEAAPRHHHHHRHPIHAVQAAPSPELQPGLSAYVPRGASTDQADVYWSPAGGNPVHYGQTTGFYAGR